MTYLDQLASRIRAALPSTASVPEDANLLFLIYAVLVRSKGKSVTASDVHDAWSAWMTTQDPDHSALVEYDLLPAEVRAEDAPFLAAIQQVVMDLGPPRS